MYALLSDCVFVLPVCLLRAYVEFYRTSQDLGVLPEVSLALLLAQQNHPLQLSVYPIDQIEVSAGNRNIAHMKYARYGSYSHNMETSCSSLKYIYLTFARGAKN